jgi:hypothetical protein
VTTVPDDVRERLVSYFKHQAAKGTGAIEEAVAEGHEQFIGLLDGISEEQARFKPSAEVWSILEVLQHAATTKRELALLCAALSRGETYEHLGPEGEEASTQDGIMRVQFNSLAEARSATESAHGVLMAFIDGLSPNADLEARYKHFIFGALNCREWAVFQRVHDGDHARQIEKIKAAPGFPSA